MARIYVDAWGLKNEPDGIARYCRGLISRLPAAAPHHELIVLTPPGAASIAPGLTNITIHRPRTDWATLTFRPALDAIARRYGRADLYHSLFQMLPLGIRGGQAAPRAIVVTLHDVICLTHPALAAPSWIKRQWTARFDRFAIPYAIRTADHVICDSQATAEAARPWLAPANSTVVHPGVDGGGFPPAWPRPDWLRPEISYLAAFGVSRPYKNVDVVIRALAAVRARRPDVGVVLIGGDGGARQTIDALGVGDVVVVTPRLSDADLRATVAAARLFVVPSTLEGFGLPTLEAMAAGVPVAVADIPVLSEVAGEAALRFDPHSAEALAAIVERVLVDTKLARDLAQRGLTRAREFSWDRTAEQTVAVYDRMLE